MGVAEVISDLISGKISLPISNNKQETFSIKKDILEVYQCSHCLTVYDSKFGDLEQNISASTKWIDVPESYKCPVCEADKTEFTLKTYDS